MLKEKNIEIKLNNNTYNISFNLDRKIWIDKNLDFTCFEIIYKDDIMGIIDPFQLEINNITEYKLEKYNNRGIGIISGAMPDKELSQGILYYVKNNQNIFLHDCNTESGFSGGPILLINNLKVIGIHRGYAKYNKKNVGIYFYPERLNQKNAYKLIIEKREKQNSIKILIETKENKDKILLFNQNNNNKEEIENNIKVYLENKIVQIKNINDHYIINHNFEKNKKYEIKIVFNKEITDLKQFFENCREILTIDLSYFKTSKVNNMELMFNKCQKLKEIKGMNKIRTNNVINMYSMFQYCNELEYLDLSSFDTKNVTNMGLMFSNCYKIREIKGINQFNTINVIDMHSMFEYCNELEFLDLSNFDTKKVENFGFMFNDCKKIKEIKGIHKLNTSNAVNMKGCLKIAMN